LKRTTYLHFHTSHWVGQGSPATRSCDLHRALPLGQSPAAFLGRRSEHQSRHLQLRNESAIDLARRLNPVKPTVRIRSSGE
jgi:hypothetical protein